MGDGGKPSGREHARIFAPLLQASPTPGDARAEPYLAKRHGRVKGTRLLAMASRHQHVRSLSRRGALLAAWVVKRSAPFITLARRRNRLSAPGEALPRQAGPPPPSPRPSHAAVPSLAHPPTHPAPTLQPAPAAPADANVMEVLAQLVDVLKQRQLLKLVVLLGAAELAAGAELGPDALAALQAGLRTGATAEASAAVSGPAASCSGDSTGLAACSPAAAEGDDHESAPRRAATTLQGGPGPIRRAPRVPADPILPVRQRSLPLPPSRFARQHLAQCATFQHWA